MVDKEPTGADGNGSPLKPDADPSKTLDAELILSRNRIVGLKGWVSRMFTAVEASLANSNPYSFKSANSDLNRAISTFDEIKDTAKRVSTIYCELGRNADYKTFEAKMDDYVTDVNEHLREYFGSLHAYEEIQEAKKRDAAAASAAATPPKKPSGPRTEFPVKVNLPKLPLPTFDGDVMFWNSFYDQFMSTIDKREMEPVVKLNYLIQCLSGEALAAIKGFPISNGSYRQALHLLKSRYAVPSKIIQANLDALLNVKEPEYSAKGLQAFSDKLRTHIRILEQNGKPEELYSDMLVASLKPKLPNSVKSSIIRDFGLNGWTLENIFLKLETEIEILEVTNSFKDVKLSVSESATFMTTGTISNPKFKAKFPCTFCKGDHLGSACLKYPTPKSKHERIKALKLCFNCLRSHPHVPCKVDTRCKKCGRAGHHHLLCLIQKNSSSLCNC